MRLTLKWVRKGSERAERCEMPAPAQAHGAARAARSAERLPPHLLYALDTFQNKKLVGN